MNVLKKEDNTAKILYIVYLSYYCMYHVLL